MHAQHLRRDRACRHCGEHQRERGGAHDDVLVRHVRWQQPAVDVGCYDAGCGLVDTLAYKTNGDLDTVTYSGGDFTLGYGYDSGGRVSKLEWKKGATLIAKDEVVISSGGRVIDESIDGVDQSPGAAGFTYDNKGRLIGAVPVSGTSISYGFADSNGCGWVSAGENSNRTAKTVNGVTTSYCYDDADRLTSSSPGGAVTYDAFGRTTGLSGKTFGWSMRSEHTSTSWAGTTIGYERDGFWRVIKRTQTGQPDLWYGYGGTSDSSSYTATAPNGGRSR